MGNKMCVSRRRAVADRFTRPQRLLQQPSDVDYKKLRKLILAQKLAPCFDALDDPQLAGVGDDLEECPICFLYYPSLNRSRCCAKGICTECFLQMKPSHASRPAQCPFCKTSCYAVEYHGARTEEERGLEQAEEQKVIEARIRLQSESQTEATLVPIKQPQTLLELLHPFPGVDGSTEQNEERVAAGLEGSGLQETMDVHLSDERQEEVHVEPEEIMLMEAIWQSLQDCRSHRSEASPISRRLRTGTTSLYGDQGENFSTSTFSEGASAAIARLAEHDILQQEVSQLDGETSQTNRDPCGDLVHESSSTQPEPGCSSGLARTNVKQPCMVATELNA